MTQQGVEQALAELWQGWSENISGGVLVAAFAALAAPWIAAVVLTLRQSRRAWEPHTMRAMAVLFVPPTVAAIGIARPLTFEWWALFGLVLAPLVAVVTYILEQRWTRLCPASHPMARHWSFCPRCPSSSDGIAGEGSKPRQLIFPNLVSANFVGSRVSTLLRRPQPSNAPVAIAGPVDRTVLVRLVPAASGVAEVVVHRPGASIGRDPAAHIAIDDPSVSWDHAQIVARDGAPALVDNGSSNGTFVNGERVEQTLLLSGDRVKFGDTEYRVVRP